MLVSTSLRRAGTALAFALGTVVLGAAAVSAHVTVSSPDAAAGGFGKLVFRVPSESDTAETESVTVQLPTDNPFRFVSTKAMPGWQVETKSEKLDEPVTSDGFEITEAVTEVTWTAASGSALNPHEFAEFELSVGPFPKDADELTFPTTQRYSDGELAAWDQPTVAGEAEPERPAPVLVLSPASVASVSAATTDDSDSEAAGAGTDNVARTLGGLGLAPGLVALVLSGVRGRRQSA